MLEIDALPPHTRSQRERVGTGALDRNIIIDAVLIVIVVDRVDVPPLQVEEAQKNRQSQKRYKAKAPADTQAHLGNLRLQR